FDPSWQRWLAALAWVSAIVGAGIALARRSPCVRLSAVFVGHAGIVFLAGAAATPAAVAGSVLYLVTTLFLVALLWLLATNATGQRSRQRPSDVARTPGFWLQVILIASAVGLPFTVGGLARSAFVDALTAWPAGNQLHRFPLIIADGATLVVAASLLWDARYLLPLRGWSGWLGVATAALVLVLPTILPGPLIATWFDPAAAAASGTAAPPLALVATPSPFSIGLGVLAFWILLQRIRNREWLPAVGHAFMGAAALGWLALRRQWRQRGWSAAPSVAGTLLWRRLQRSAERAMAFLRPFEERYYAGVAVLLAVAAIYIIGR
ncbi:MAG TPA: proton-conducting transporter membrane subunit, partial [Chloroflexota bacterium]|nr:proton-conducting transporter membrane subunit [Chloroflexota bacterium]